MINGYAAEQILFNLIKNSPKIKGFKLPSSEELINIASQSQLGRKRIKSATSFLLEEFGVNYRHPKTNQLSRVLDWQMVPSSIILDYIFGIDTVVNILGFTIAIDVTVNSNKIEEKQQKLTNLKPLWQEIGIDKACVCYVSNPNSNCLWQSLKSVTKQSQVTTFSL
ncbi:hypothetical protein [Crocosphaera chwakensis]|uniref:Endonuclease n=1 Tax=Crocosphaera chwakensis CCY0110 TaxID=391612 RepID=A3IY26_9CHRO|nr:hypothetical protein [Crocosphaera chwakensis]EAZ88602.1 hypothetical protein CY0110_31395 [Crocosphaera chwakensis CCY0110]